MAAIPPLLAEYAACPICPSNAAMEATLTIRPRSPSERGSLAAITAAALRVTSKAPIRLTLMTDSNMSSG